jgi:trehalose-phosphatase
MIDDLKALVDLPCLYYAGTGGLELDLGGVQLVPSRAAEKSLLVSELAHRLQQLSLQYTGSWVEAKRLGLTVHYRGLAAGRVPEFRECVEQILRSAPDRLRVGSGPMAIEVTLDLGWDKGFAVRRIVEHVRQPVLLLYAGDEANDVEALREVTARGGVTIGIGPRAPFATLRLPDPAALRTFLWTLLGMLESGCTRIEGSALARTEALR